MHANILVDKARDTCSPATYSALAVRLGVTRQQVHQWKKGLVPIAEHHLRSMCRMANLDVAEWWLAVQSDSAPEPMRPKLQALLKKAGIAALLGVMVTPAWAGTGHAVSGISVAELALLASPIRHYAKFCILTTPRC